MITINATGDTTIHTAGKYCPEDILVKVPEGSGGGSVETCTVTIVAGRLAGYAATYNNKSVIVKNPIPTRTEYNPVYDANINVYEIVVDVNSIFVSTMNPATVETYGCQEIIQELGSLTSQISAIIVTSDIEIRL